MDKLTVNSFFCGAGGFDLGFIKAGYNIVGAWDFDKYVVESYKANIGEHIKQADVTTLKGVDIPFANVWLFGFPCQDVSVAGRKAGMVKGKTRTGLFYEIMRLLTEVEEKPEMILAENVKGLKKYLPVVESEFNKVGYRFYVTLYNSKDFGVPQSRERYFMVGVREDLSIDFNFPVPNPTPVKLAEVLEENVPEKFYYEYDRVANVIEKYTCNHIVKEGEINVIGLADGINGHDILKRVYNINGVSPTLNTCNGGNTQPKILVYDRDKIRVRKLTPREFARLQGFPDSYKQVVSDSQFYKQMGNAVTVNVAYAIAEQIKKIFADGE